MGFSKNNQQLSTARRREERFFSPPSQGRRRNQIIKCEKRHRKRKKGMNLSARLPSWGYLLRRGASEHASRGGYIARAMQRGKQWRRRPWQKGRHGPSMLHLANTDGCQGLASQACPLQVAPRPSEPTLKGPTCCLRGLSSNDMPHSPLKLGRWAPPPRQWEERWYCCRRTMVEREKCSEWLCLCWGSV